MQKYFFSTKSIRNLSFTTICILCISVFTCCKTTKSTPTTSDKSIVVLYDNDVHCQIEGYQKMAGLRDAISDTAYVAVVSNGDYLHGGTVGVISSGQYVIDIMKHVRYDAVTLGNHEFDYGIEKMKSLLKQLDTPVICSNLCDMQNRMIFEPYVIKNFGNKKVAFVGVVTPTALYTEAYSFFDKDDIQTHNLREKEVYAIVQEQVNTARRQGADYVIVLSHLGEDENTLNVDSHGLIKATTGIDVLLDGHSHSVKPHDIVNNKNGKPVIISQTGTQFSHIGKLLITKQGEFSTELIPTDCVSHINAEVKNSTDSISHILNEIVNKQVCKSDVKLIIKDENGRYLVRRAETNAGDIICDAIRLRTGADIAMINGGAIRTDVKPGSITYGDVIAILPYDDFICSIEITGQELVDLLTSCTQFLPTESGDFPQVSGIKFTISAGKGKSISDLVILNKQTNLYEPVSLTKTYELATPDYCVTGGGFQNKLKKNKVIKSHIIHYRNCLLQYLTDNLKGHIGADYTTSQGRITINY